MTPEEHDQARWDSPGERAKRLAYVNDRNAAATREVVEIAKRQGFGFVMAEAARAWRGQDAVGALVVGPAAAFTVECPCRAERKAERQARRAAGDESYVAPRPCDLCHGCGWQFRREAT